MKNNLASRIATTVTQLAFATILTCVGSLSWAQTSSDENALCRDIGIVFAFFNGVLTTLDEADYDKMALRKIYGNSYRGEGIRYEVMYNYTAGMEDFVEVFEQRLKEHEGLLEGRFELFFEALHGDGSWWQRIEEAIPAATDILRGFVDYAEAARIRLLTWFLANPPTFLNYQEHAIRVDTLIREGKKLLFFAHSQGNLFANAAYAHAMTKTSPDSVKVVHVAPASAQLNGLHVLAAQDRVIHDLLSGYGYVPEATDEIPNYRDRPPGLNGETDILGHGLLEIYLNPALATAERIHSYVQGALDTLVAPPAVAKSGFFTLTLVWDGPGNIDLHVYEPWDPDRNIHPHVYFDNMTGKSGYLSTDNKTGYGPEQYRATCNPSKLATGMYFVGIANREGADGRFAAVQLASSEGGLLGTRFATMYEPTGETTRPTMFLVYVKRDPQTGRYKVTFE